MDQLVIVTHPEPLALEARQIVHEAVPDGGVGMGYYYDGKLIARSVVTEEAIGAIHTMLSTPVSVALAATEDDDGNIDGRICLVLHIDASRVEQEDDEADEPWKASVPRVPDGIESGSGYAGEGEDRRPQLALFPLGNVIRNARSRNHPEDVAADAKEMLDNLLSGRAQDAVQRAIDDLLNSL